MPFGLKNAGATYQRLVNNMFQEKIGKNMEVYIDDMLIKSKRKEDHTRDLQACFGILQRFGMKLNPAKCTFGVHGGKFLGFMISQRGIEVNPEKINAILEMQPPQKHSRSPKADGAFGSIKPFYLTVIRQGAPIFQVSAVLTREEARGLQPVYYVSNTLQGAEERYPHIEKLTFSLVVATRKLRHYFQSHPVVVLQTILKQVLAEPNISGRMVKWALELSEHGIEYRLRPTIKAQALADFMVELTSEEKESDQSWWKLFVDGPSTSQGSGAGVILETPQGERIQYALRFNFNASNNEAEYEALLAGMKLAQAAGAKYLEACSNSQLVVNQVKGDFEAKEKRMA
ncbi:UNVERIFIED_CONTAM: Retrovirus-related Pol polyprotein from transposon opus [Sesamum radiatum]|uniref:Retrovirus-related Pol polyprotein from transposon opus n=1 Tax=Sesamum radiatum TaxID=300843 RepID=A0AAW2QGM1_SESRA